MLLTSPPLSTAWPTHDQHGTRWSMLEAGLWLWTFSYCCWWMKWTDSMDVPGGWPCGAMKISFAISIGTACVALTSSKALSWEIVSEQDAQRIDLGFGVCIWGNIAITEGVHAMLLPTLWPSIVISHRSICILHSISSYTQHSSRTNTSVCY